MTMFGIVYQDTLNRAESPSAAQAPERIGLAPVIRNSASFRGAFSHARDASMRQYERRLLTCGDDINANEPASCSCRAIESIDGRQYRWGADFLSPTASSRYPGTLLCSTLVLMPTALPVRLSCSGRRPESWGIAASRYCHSTKAGHPREQPLS